MQPIHLFYSWQSDRGSKVCRNFIRHALEAAIANLKGAHGIEIYLDSDTSGVPGTPHVSDTILRKIRECDIFLGDVTFVGSTSNGKKMPNPNVMIEFGYARGVLTDRQILLLMNAAFGPAQELPFDLAHLRHPTQYSVQEDASDGVRRGQRTKLAEILTHHLKAIVDDVLATRASRKPSADTIAPAHAVVTNLIQMINRGETPAIVPGPRLVVKLVTAEAATTGSVTPGSISSIRPKFIPARYSESTAETNSREWSEFDPPRFVQGKPNPESRWYLRVLRSGAIDAAITVGERIDDDKDILVDIEPLEARVVEMAKRMGEIASAVGDGGPLVIHAALEGLEDVRLGAQHKSSKRLGTPFVHLGTVDMPSTSSISIENLRQMLDAIWLAAGFPDGSPLYGDGITDDLREKMLVAPEVISGRA
ncbi:hypothetical protein QM996_31355 (plasmid) [Sinorhizobium chiapasense]|uniref:hypothetical protein n=1 Tax=Sinorhizobium chiapasense TaxID=501572 RepID=UPI002FE3BC79